MIDFWKIAWLLDMTYKITENSTQFWSTFEK